MGRVARTDLSVDINGATLLRDKYQWTLQYEVNTINRKAGGIPSKGVREKYFSSLENALKFMIESDAIGDSSVATASELLDAMREIHEQIRNDLAKLELK